MKLLQLSGILPALMLFMIAANARSAAEINTRDAADKTISDDTGKGPGDIDSKDGRENKPDGMLIEEPGNNNKKTGMDIEKPKIENKTGKNTHAFFDPSSVEYLALFVGYGGYFPVADYGKAYKPGHMVSFTAGVYYINFLGLSPEVHARYATMDYKEDPLRYRASLSQVQVYPAIIYRYPVRLPRNTLTVYGRIWDGLSRIYYKSQDPYFPLLKKNIIENLNVFGLSAGCYYDVWKGFLLGFDVSYSVVSTARKPLHSVSLTLNAGWRIL